MKSLFVAGVAAVALALSVGGASAQTSTGAQPNQYSPVNGAAQVNGQPNQYSPVNGAAQVQNGQPNQYSPVNGAAQKTSNNTDNQKKTQ